MKKIVGLFLAVALITSFVVPISIEASITDQLRYEVVANKEIHILGCKSDCPEILNIPETIEGLPVTEIADEAFYIQRTDYADTDIKPTYIKQVKLPKSLKRIGQRAFYWQDLQQVILPEGLKEIGHHAFSENEQLANTTLTIPKSVEKIELRIGQFKKVVFPPHFSDQIAKTSGDFYYEVFKNNGKFEVRITDYKRQTSKTTLTVPAKIDGLPVTEIGFAAFTEENRFNTTGMVSPVRTVILPDSIRKIDDYAFYTFNGRENGIELKLPSSLQSIGKYAFFYNSIKGTLTLPDSLKTIGEGAFMLNRISTVSIPESLTKISKKAFFENEIKALMIPKSVTAIEPYAFANNQLYELTIPSTVKELGEYTFNKNRLNTVHIKGDIKVIPSYAFSENRISELSLPKRLQTIEDNAFSLNLLENLVLEDTVTKVGARAFYGNKIGGITLFANNAHIEENAFSFNELNMIDVRGENVFLGRQSHPEQPELIAYADYELKKPFTNWGSVNKQPFKIYFTKNGEKPTEPTPEQPVVPVVPTLPEEGKPNPSIPVTLKDIKGNWAEEIIIEFVDKGIVSGYPDGTFRPNEPMKRKHVAALLAKVYPLEPVVPAVTFKDVSAKHPNAAAITKLQRANVIHGSDGYFNPEGTLTRGQFAKILSLTMGIEAKGSATFQDVKSDYWAAGYISALADRNIVGGDRGNYKPNAPVTRAQFVAMLKRALHQ
ncbi:MAG: leucine-rich repeat protein [Solibacillus sp.]